MRNPSGKLGHTNFPDGLCIDLRRLAPIQRHLNLCIGLYFLLFYLSQILALMLKACLKYQRIIDL